MLVPTGHMLADSAAGHPTQGGAYFDILEFGLHAQGMKSIILSSDKITIPVKARGVGGSALAREVRFIPLRLGNATVVA